MLGVKSLSMYSEPCDAMSAIVVAMRSPPLQHVGLLSIRSVAARLQSSSWLGALPVLPSSRRRRKVGVVDIEAVLAHGYSS